MKRIRVGVVGQGRSGHDIHVAAFKAMPGRFKVVAVADPLDGRCGDAVSATGCTAYTDYHDMLKRKDLDLIVNSTPSHLHVPVTLEILDAGFNVLTEKPLARRASDVIRSLPRQSRPASSSPSTSNRGSPHTSSRCGR
jgi:scyllo-inositol 2-dehydrogenase (NADP+)